MKYPGRAVLTLLIVLFFGTELLFSQRTVIEKKSKVVTYENQIIWTRHLSITTDSVSFKRSDGSLGSIGIKEVKSISVKIGSSFPAVMGIALGLGLVYSLISPNTPKDVNKVTFGLAIGGLGRISCRPVHQATTDTYLF